MTVFTPNELITLLLRNHPTLGANPIVPAIAICLAESGGRTDAISPSHDYGLWQINIAHFGDGIINSGNWTNPDVQVAEMWSLSSGGHNWAAWCTAWIDPEENCGHGFLSLPEPGSPAADNLSIAQNVWNARHGTPAPGQAPDVLPPAGQDERAVSAAFGYLRNYYGTFANRQYRQIVAATNAARKVGG